MVHRNNQEVFFGAILLRLIPIIILLVMSSNVLSQNLIKGTVTAASDGSTMPGVNVVVKGTTNGTITDLDGNYSITATEEDVLVFTFIGFLNEEIAVGNKTNIDVSLIEDFMELDEIVVVGYGTVKKNELTGSVSTVDPEGLEGMPVSDVGQMLQGTVAGVQTIASSGAPDATQRIRIRGFNSISSSNKPLIVVDGFVVEDINSVNPNDIERIDVLKDPSALAIYGARASTGVILITTKSGKESSGQINFSYSGTISQGISKKIDVFDARQYTEYVNEAMMGDGASRPRFPSRTYPFTPNIEDTTASIRYIDWNTDWHNEVYQPGKIDEYQLSASGGSEKHKYYLSGNYYDQQGIVRGSEFKRLGGSFKSSSQIKQWLTLGTNVNALRKQYNGEKGRWGSIAKSILSTTGYILPYDTITNNFQVNNLQGVPHDNPLAQAIGQVDELILDDIRLNAYADVSFNEELKLTIRGTYNRIERRHGKAWDDRTIQGRSVDGMAQQSSYTDWRTVYESFLTYNKILFDFHHVNAIAGYSTEKDMRDSWSFSGQNLGAFLPWDYHYITSSNTINVTGNVATRAIPRKLESFFGRLNYPFNEKYLFSYSIRRDGSSVFSENEKYATFQAFALGWNVHDEPFMQFSKNYLSQFKLRASYGSVGSQAISPGQSLSTYTNATTINNGIVAPAVVPSPPGNASLKWETTTSFNTGLDISLFRNRISFNGEYYDKVTDDILFYDLFPYHSGAPEVTSNVGSVQNRGVELTLHSVNISRNRLSWTTNFTYSKNNNEVLNITTGVDEFESSSAGIKGTLNGSLNWVIEGEPIGTFKGYIYDGVYTDQATADLNNARLGDPKYKDIDGDGVFEEGDDIAIIGNALPDFTAGVLNKFSYYDFDLSILFNAMVGNDMYNLTRQSIETVNGSANQSIDMLNRSRLDENDEWIFTDIPRASGFNKTIRTDRFIEDASFIRLQNIALTYNIPQVVLERLKISNMSVYVSGQNLYIWTRYKGYDPEVNSAGDDDLNSGIDDGAYPNTRTIMFGLKVGL